MYSGSGTLGDKGVFRTWTTRIEGHPILTTLPSFKGRQGMGREMESIRRDESRMEVGGNPGAPRQEKGPGQENFCLPKSALSGHPQRLHTVFPL